MERLHVDFCPEFPLAFSMCSTPKKKEIREAHADMYVAFYETTRYCYHVEEQMVSAMYAWGQISFYAYPSVLL